MNLLTRLTNYYFAPNRMKLEMLTAKAFKNSPWRVNSKLANESLATEAELIYTESVN